MPDITVMELGEGYCEVLDCHEDDLVNGIWIALRDSRDEYTFICLNCALKVGQLAEGK